ncbi:MAG TPA: small ribosomal subunit Rsm22 family protein [Ktedonobacteraceae bacterium]|nr:small ribosomal subunit Rsm22 family protein [Ktedonobacteraceae bacterium]
MDLPDDLRIGLEETLHTTTPKSLAHLAEDLSRRYRTGHAQGKQAFLRSEEDIIAYAAYRLPATFAAIHAALTEVKKRQPDLQLHTMLDAGAGPGTVVWAATTLWPELERVVLLERDPHMIAYGKRLATHARVPAIKEVRWQHVDLIGQWEHGAYDLVVAAYVLGELPQPTLDVLLSRLWSCTNGVLLLVEPGTPRGFSLIRHAREYLLSSGAKMVAPCPHNGTCPMPAHDWCHFAQRITRTRLQRAIKGASLSYEDEKFSYVALSPRAGSPITGRVLRHPQKRSGHIHLELCTPDGLKHTIVTRSQHTEFREAQDLHWGEAISEIAPE